MQDLRHCRKKTTNNRNMKFITALLMILALPILAHGQQKDSYNIGILLDAGTPELSYLLDSLKAEITAVVGEDADIVFPDESILTKELDIERAAQNYQTLISNDTDIIIAFGQINNTIISNQEVHVKPTILFGAVNLDLVDFDENKQTSGIENFTYLIASQSYRRDLEVFKSIFDYRRVGVVEA